MKGLLVREAAPADAAALLAIQKAAFARTALENGVAEIPPTTQSLESFTEDFKTHVVLGAELDGRWVGLIRGRLKDGALQVGRLAVEPSMEGKGIGRMLLEAMEKRYPQVERYELFTGLGNVRNLRFYEKAGYRKVRIEPGPPGLVFMEKRVPG